MYILICSSWFYSLEKMSELSEHASTSCSSDISGFSDDSNLSIDAGKIREEEIRMKREHAKEERAMLKKLREEKMTQEKKERALKSMNYLLNTSKKYSSFFLNKFKSYDFEEKK